MLTVLLRHAGVIGYLLVTVALFWFQPGYNHIFAAYLLMNLVVFTLRLWAGLASPFDLITIAAFLATCILMLATGTADTVPYFTVALFAATAAASAAAIVVRRPRVFRDAGRVAENYIDTALRTIVAVACLVMSLAWMPQPRYLIAPMVAVIAFRLSVPIRRYVYSQLTRTLAPVDWAVGAGPAAPAWQATPARVATLALSVAIASVIGPRLLLTIARYDVSIPKPYTLPIELLQQRRAELERYAATAEGRRDSQSLTELGLVLHNLGLNDQATARRAATVLEQALAIDPANAQAHAWHGSTVVSFAIFEVHPIARMRFVAQGLEELDRAVAAAPDDPIVRLARVDVCLGIPRFIDRLDTARADVERLLALLHERPEAADPIAPSIHQRAADVFALAGDRARAAAEWRAALDLLPEDSDDYKTILTELGRPSQRAAPTSVVVTRPGA